MKPSKIFNLILTFKEEERERLIANLSHLLVVLSIRDRHFLPRCALQLPHVSGLRHLLLSRNDMAYIEILSLNCAAFDFLLRAFKPVWKQIIRPITSSLHAPQKQLRKGRPRSTNARYCLAVTLMWLNSWAPGKDLQLASGLTPTVFSVALNMGLDILYELLPTIPDAQIRWPSVEEMAELSSVVRLKMGDVLPSTWGMVDGLNLRIEEPFEPDIQNAYFNQWLQGVYCSSVFVFRADGPIAWSRLNCPGSWHDARIAYPLYGKLLRSCPLPYNVVSDTAFPRTKLMESKIWAGRKVGDVEPADRREARKQQNRHAAITYMRQSAEWGMRQLQGQFGRLKGVLPRSANKRRKILAVIAGLYNFRCRQVGLNQIRTVYDRVSSGNHILWPDTGLAREGGIDRGAAYYRQVM